MDNPVMIFGAGFLGRAAKEIFEGNGNVVYGFLDDSKNLHSTEIDNAPVLGSTDDDGYLKLIGKKANIDAVGAVVKYQAGDLTRSRMKVGGGSYLSSHDPRIVLGLGKRTKLDWLEIRWPQPSGLVQRFTNLPIDRYITLTEGRANWE